MIENNIKSNLIYQEFKNEEECFNKLYSYLNEGFEFFDTSNLTIGVKKGDLKILLSYTHIDNMEKNYDSKLKEFNIVKPNFNDSLLNVIAGIRNNFGYNSNYGYDKKLFDKHYDKIVLMILDGLGMNIYLNDLDKDSFLRKHFYKEITAIYPSTTAAATTSIKSGKTPLETGWTGWQNYFNELEDNIVLFTGKSYYDDSKVYSTSAFDLIPYNYFYSDMSQKASAIEPDFTNENYSFKDTLKRSLKAIKYDSLEYVYDPEPDGLLHEFGCDSQRVKDILKDYDCRIKNYVSNLKDNTLLIISADHGHIDVKPLLFYKCKPLMDLLSKLPSNDSRCATFKVKDGMKDIFKNRFNKIYGNVYDLYTKEEAIDSSFFGDKNGYIEKHIDTFLADFIAVAKSNYYFEFREGLPLMKSHHAGMTEEEMKIPLIVVKK